MFVVRLKRPNEDFDVKTFKSEARALARFRAAQQEIIDGDVESCALFDAGAVDADAALALVGRGKGRLLASNLSDGPPQVAAAKRRAAKKRGTTRVKPDRPSKRSSAR